MYGETLLRSSLPQHRAEWANDELSFKGRIIGQVIDSLVDFPGVPNGLALALAEGNRPLQLVLKYAFYSSSAGPLFFLSLAVIANCNSQSLSRPFSTLVVIATCELFLVPLGHEILPLRLPLFVLSLYVASIHDRLQSLPRGPGAGALLVALFSDRQFHERGRHGEKHRQVGSAGH